MATEDMTTPSVHPEAGAHDPDERLKRARHDLRGSLGVLQGALQTALDQDLSLAQAQRMELISIARQALPELEAALDALIAAMGDPGDIRLPE